MFVVILFIDNCYCFLLQILYLKMTSNMTERLAFEAEWFDTNADLIKKFYLYFYTSDCTIELVS